MELKSTQSHMVGGKILVNGTTYDIDDEGYILIDDPDDIEKLLAGKDWEDPDESKKSKRDKAAQSGKPKKHPEMTLLDASGNLVEGQEKSKDQEKSEDREEGDPPIPTDKKATWPDPKEEYSLGWLRACADAYNVKYSPRLGKQKLIDRIIDVMYED